MATTTIPTCPRCESERVEKSKKAGSMQCLDCGCRGTEARFFEDRRQMVHRKRNPSLEGLSRGARIGKLCELCKMTQRELARHLEVTDVTVSRWVGEVYKPDIDQYAAMYRLFRTSLPELSAEEMLGW